MEEKSREEEAVAAADAEVNAVEIGNEEYHRKPVLRRDPSFSRWCDVNGILRSNAAADDGSPGTSSAAEEAEEFELPLLHHGRSEEADTEAEDQMRSQSFRQRSMCSGNANGDATKYAPLDIENGVHATDSMAKLQSLEQSKGSPISAVIVLKTLLYILVWYTFSTCLTVYNKTLLGDHLGKFPAPLLMNTVHFSMQAILSNAIVYIQSRISESNRNTMPWKDYFIRVIPTAIATALDVNLSNESLVFISVTFATMCKSASPIFLLVFAFVFRLETPSFKLLGIILIIAAGVLLTGFIAFLCALASNITLKKEAYGLKNPIALMSYVTPVMALITAVLSLLLDPWLKFKGNNYFNSSKHIMQSCLLMLLGGALAFFMVLTEYILVSATSAVTVTVAGIVKEALTIMVAVFYFHDQFTWLKGFGLFTIMVGVSLFNWYKYHKLIKGQQTENEGTHSRSIDRAAKYVILDDMELQDA
ncbi:ubiquitin domain-containing protein [Musa troglodytarum]|uniref:Ubiquitin domain-containing protein n=1 Tax=Musa troglodytarum TaxID=320322 RepID=A0A9E7GQ55_9LILI|nr:ubiquitin domain-containing protein [Musa troglodytarum]